VQATGVPRDQLIGTDFSAYLTDPAKAREGYQKAFAEGLVRDLPLAVRHVSGRVMDVVCNAIVYHDAQGRALGVFAAARDITERKRAEEVLSASQAKLHAIIEASPVAMAVSDEYKNITFLNRRFTEIFGYTLEDIPTVAAWWPLAYPDPAYRERQIQVWQEVTEKAHREGTCGWQKFHRESK
jgi:PAS domain S-box-containing protein